MIYAHVIHGRVDNIIVAPDQAIADAVAPPGALSVDVTGLPVGIGWTHDGEDFLPPPPPPEDPAPA